MVITKEIKEWAEYAKKIFLKYKHVTIGPELGENFCSRYCYYYDEDLKIRGECRIIWDNEVDDYVDCEHTIEKVDEELIDYVWNAIKSDVEGRIWWLMEFAKNNNKVITKEEVIKEDCTR